SCGRSEEVRAFFPPAQPQSEGGRMSALDRWLVLDLSQIAGPATSATSATSAKNPKRSAAFCVAKPLRHACDTAAAPETPPFMSQDVATRLRHGEPRKTARFCPMSQMSPMSQGVATEAANWHEVYAERAAFREFEAGYRRSVAENLAYGETVEAWCREH